jgi:hypothetical protein
MQLDFEIDKLTHSLEDAITGEILSTEVLLLEKADLKFVSKKFAWKFDWQTEFSVPEKLVFKLVLHKDPKIIQGLI